ncbi:hypothetical protein HKD37_18G050535 [Glycine soja]
MASKNENVPVVVYYDAYVADCDDGVEFKGGNNVLVSMKRGKTFNALKTRIQCKMGLNQGQIITSESNKMSHDYHAQNGLPNEVVGDFSDNEDQILADNNNINVNDNNDIQFLFQSTSTKNVYRPYPNSADVGDNQVADNPDYRHFLDQQQQSDSHDGELYVGKNILAMVEENEQLTIPTFIAFVRQEFRYTITYCKAWLAKQWALEIQTIPALDESNQPIPNKVIFHRLFWSFKAWIDAFAFCKPIVKINGIRLYGRYKGTLLTHVTPQHGYAMTQPEFFCHYQELQEDNPHDTAWLDQIPREQWTLAWDEGKQWGHMTTNLAESLNSADTMIALDKFTHLLQPSSSPKKKLSPTLTSLNSLTAKDVNFKLRKK